MKIIFFWINITLGILLSCTLSCTVTNQYSVKLSSAVEGDISFTVVGVVDLDSLLNRSDIITRTDLITRSDLTAAGITSPVNIPISDVQSEKAPGNNPSYKQTAGSEIATEELVVTVNCDVSQDGDSSGEEVFADENGAFSVSFSDVTGDGTTLSCSLYLVVSTAGSSILKNQVSAEDLEKELVDEFVDEYALTDDVNDQYIDVGDVESTEDGELSTDTIEVVDSVSDADEDSVEDSTALMLDLRLVDGAATADPNSNGISTTNNGVVAIDDESEAGGVYFSFEGDGDGDGDAPFLGVTLSDTFKNNFASQLSIEATIRIRMNEIMGSISPIASLWTFPAGGGQPIGWFVLFAEPNDEATGFTVHFQLATSNEETTVGVANIESIQLFELGIWTQVLVTYDLATSQLKLYIDGVEDSGNCNCGNFGTIDIGNEINIGKASSFDATNFYFTGDIRVLRIYNEVFTPEELE